MYIPGPAINIYGTPRFVARKLFADDSRIKRKPPKSTTEGESKPGYLCWGQVGNMPTAAPVPEVSFEVHDEQSRETTPVRIVNPDDPNQYVDALQTNKMKLKITDPEEKNNSDTLDAHLDALETSGNAELRKHAENIRTGNYTVQYKPPERAL